MSEGSRIATGRVSTQGTRRHGRHGRVFRVDCPNNGNIQPRTSSHSNIHNCQASDTHSTRHGTTCLHSPLLARREWTRSAPHACGTLCMYHMHVVCMARPFGQEQEHQRTQTNWLPRACERCFAGRVWILRSPENSNNAFSGCHWTAMKG